MDYNYIASNILQVYKNCNVKSFPIDCIEIINLHQLSCYKYSELDSRLRQYCLMFSEDAFKFKDKICYNDENIWSRSRFSLMHELGHIILNTESEILANEFASMILAPPIAIHYSRCRTKHEISKAFGISRQASEIVLERYNLWHDKIQNHNNKMCKADKELYEHFYNKNAKGFVWSRKECKLCKNVLYNHPHDYCFECKMEREFDSVKSKPKKIHYALSSEDKSMVQKLENSFYFNL